jgi:superfamily II DNA or RNA helicase
MNELSNENAYRELRKALAGEILPDSFTCKNIPFERLRKSLVDTKLSSFDRTVRLRHALRYADTNWISPGSKHSFKLNFSKDWVAYEAFSTFGLTVRPGANIEASPWKPTWLSGASEKGVDATASESSQRRWINKSPKADPWITKNFKFNDYRGPGQSLAVRSALHLPEDQTLLILLPTGEGKSLIFQSLACAHPGKTIVVVVPTIALALDHAESISEFPFLQPDQPHAYIGGELGDNETIKTAIGLGTQGLLFAAPEAIVYGGLSSALLNAARDGKVAALVIDEAHLVNAWGTDFRSEFQLLSAFAAELRSLSPIQQKPKVICLSATVSQLALKTLESLFSPNGKISIIPAARLRPEPEIWVSPVCNSEEEQTQRVIEALHHLPRPAILYVTEIEKAELWRNRIIQIGLKRIAVVHGETSTQNREKAIQAWRTGELDLVIGTSAFGLGIDYPHVRSIIHACVPENLDRYYQEIGRSGRDNCASIAILIPLKTDFACAESLTNKKVISIKKGFARWEAMFLNKIQDSNLNTRFFVNPKVSPRYDPDMRSESNEVWNTRVLNLMVLSGLIRFSGFIKDSETRQDLIAIDLLAEDHKEYSTWLQLVEPMRQTILIASRDGLAAMKNLIKDQSCPSKALESLYKLKQGDQTFSVISACGGCAFCRKNIESGRFVHWPNAPLAPWNVGKLAPNLLNYFNAGRCIVERTTDLFNKARHQRRLAETLNRLWDFGLRKCIVIGKAPEILEEILESKPWCVVFGEKDTIISSNGLPPGPELIWIGNDTQISGHHLNGGSKGEERIFLVEQNLSDPLNSNRLLSDRINLIPFDRFHDWVQT